MLTDMGEYYKIFNPSWTSVKETPCEVTKITSPRLSWFTLNISKQTIRDLEDWKVLCISNSEQVLHMLFAGQNHLFLHLNKFFVFYHY